jgi:hypothetical protein
LARWSETILQTKAAPMPASRRRKNFFILVTLPFRLSYAAAAVSDSGTVQTRTPPSRREAPRCFPRARCSRLVG